MEPDEFRKLRVHLPRQPLVNQRPWCVAGLLLAFIILLIAAWSYHAYTKPKALPGEQRKINSKAKNSLEGVARFKTGPPLCLFFHPPCFVSSRNILVIDHSAHVTLAEVED